MSLLKSPFVSVIIPVFNGKSFLREAVESVLAEKLENIEILVMDDGSTDGSLGTISDLPVRALRSEKNQGIARTMNDGLKAAQGDWFTILDSDDRMARGGLRWRYEFAESHPKAVAVAGFPGKIIDELGIPISGVEHLHTPGYQAPAELSFSYFKAGGLFPLLTWLFLLKRRETVEKVGYFDESFRSAFDCDWLFKVSQHYTIPVVNRPTVDRRWHGSNHSHQLTGQQRKLNPHTIDEVKRVCARYGFTVGEEFHLWEYGYLPTHP